MEKINKDELNNFFNCCKELIPHLWNVLMLNLEIIDRQLEPIHDTFRAYENIAKDEKELIELVAKNSKFSNEKLKFFDEKEKQKKELIRTLNVLNEMIYFLEKNKIVDLPKREQKQQLDNYQTNDEYIKKYQRKDIKENEKKS